MSDTHPLDRRTALQSIAGIGLTALAGCSGSVSSSTTSTGGSAGAIRDVAVDATTLRVSLGERAVETVNVIAPDGTVFASRPVSTGASAVEFDLLAGSAYSPGTHSVVASAGGERVDSSEIDLVPDLRIETVGVAQNHPEMDWDKDYPYWELKSFVRVKNYGSGPESVHSLSFENVPNPTAKTRGNELKQNQPESLSPGESEEIRPRYSPFGLTPWGVNCGTSTTMEVTAGTGIGKPAHRQFSLDLAGTSLSENCSITISTVN